MLKIRDLYVRYGGIEAVQGVGLDIKRGSIVTLVGANGAGKSSIIRSIAGLNKNISGEISLTRKEGDEPVSLIGLKPEEMVRRGISLSPEGRRILPHLTVVENLRLGAYSRTDKDGINEDIERVYALFPRLKERHWQKGGTLSGGEQQMLAVGRALMSRPDMIMLDEPSLGLAPLLVKEIFNIIRRINEDGMTVLLVSDPQAVKSLSALVVPVGSLQDPADHQGLAHFLEHMTLMGSQKYPQPDSLAEFLKLHGGSHNASTAPYRTAFYLEVENDALDGAVDRLADAFLFRSNCATNTAIFSRHSFITSLEYA